MGNQPSSESPAKRLGGLLRQSNALGLSKSELDERCRPSGLYPSCHWEEKAIRRLIGDGKLAARMKGSEVRQSEQQQECPICFLNYSQVNVTKCCQAVLCTECYLQIKPQREKSTCCPFCNSAKLQVAVAGAMDDSKIRARQLEETRMDEARLRRARASEDKASSAAAAAAGAASDYSNPMTSSSGGAAREGPREFTVPPSPHSPPITLPHTPNGETTTTTRSPSSQRDIPLTGFGSSLARNERIAVLRARSESMTSDGTASSDHMTQDLVAVAMTPEERQALHADMQAQAQHPLARRLQQEEAERREMAYYRNLCVRQQQQQQQHASGMRSRRRDDLIRQFEETNPPSAGRDWNRIVDAFESGGNGPVQSLDDLVVLEAAIMLSMQEEERAAARGSASANNNNNIGRDSLSGLSSDYPSGFDAARHASRGFPLARARVQNSRRDLGENDRLSDLVRNFRNRNERPNSNSNNNHHHLSADHESLLMRGMTEEEQLAMAIAASLEEQNRDASESQEDYHDSDNQAAVSDSTATPTSNSARAAAEASSSMDGASSTQATESRAASAGTPAQSPAAMESAPVAPSSSRAEDALADQSSSNGTRISQESSPASS